MTEDLAPFFADFAVACTVNGAAVRGIFDAGWQPAEVGLVGMSSARPMLTLPTAGLSADPVGQTAVVNGISYLVAVHQPDGTGVSTLMLERA